MAVIFLLAGYLTAVALYRARATVDRGIIMKILGCQLLICAAFLFLALDVRFGFGMSIPAWLLRLAAMGLCALAAVLTVLVLLHMRDRPVQLPDLAVVPGMALEDGKPNRDLILRLETALKYAEGLPGSTLIVTGGNAGQDGRSEAAVMRDYLVARGVAGPRIMIEDQSVDTPANLRNVARMIDPARPVALITSGYHLYRAVGIARRAGFTAVQGLAAPCDGRFLAANIAWEIVCEVDGLLKGQTMFW